MNISQCILWGPSDTKIWKSYYKKQKITDQYCSGTGGKNFQNISKSNPTVYKMIIHNGKLKFMSEMQISVNNLKNSSG